MIFTRTTELKISFALMMNLNLAGNSSHRHASASATVLRAAGLSGRARAASIMIEKESSLYYRP